MHKLSLRNFLIAWDAHVNLFCRHQARKIFHAVDKRVNVEEKEKTTFLADKKFATGFYAAMARRNLGMNSEKHPCINI